MLSPKSFAIDLVRDMDDASEMEEQAEIMTRPDGLEEKDYNRIPCDFSESKAECRLRIDAEEMGRRFTPHVIQVTPPARPEEEIEPTPENAEENVVKAQEGIDILGWLRKVISLFTAETSGHLNAFKLEGFEVKGWQESASGVSNEARIMETVAGDSVVVPFEYTQEVLLPEEVFKSGKEREEVPPADGIPSDPFPPLPDSPPAESLRDVFNLASQWAKVPGPVIEAVARIEGGHLFGYSNQQIQNYSQEGGKDPKNCTPNICSAAGPMQMTTGRENADCAKCPKACEYNPNAWSTYKNAVNEATGERRNVDICNIKDSIFAATKKMKIDSGTPPGDNREWNKSIIKRVATRYYGECLCCPGGGDPELCNPGTGGTTFACQRLGRSYCEFVWEYYQENK